MEQNQKEIIFNLINDNKFSIFNHGDKDTNLSKFLNDRGIKLDFKITLRNVVKFLKNIEDKCTYSTCFNQRPFIGFRNDENRTEFGFKKFCSKECFYGGISERQLGSNNTCHRMSKESFKSMCDKNSKIMKDKIKNGEFKPNITNSWHRGTSYLFLENRRVKYRSSWEAFFHLCNMNLEYENLVIEYKYRGNKHNYIVDFVDTENKFIYEIKPNTSINIEKNRKKSLYAKRWCKKNGYEFKYITEEWLFDNFNKNEHLLDNQPDGVNIKRKLKKYINEDK